MSKVHSLSYTRRTSAEWQHIMDEFFNSGLSGAAYCREHNIQYASFCKQRQQRSKINTQPQVSSSHHLTPVSSPGFVNVSALSAISSTSTRPDMSDHKDSDNASITLSLGSDITLTVRR